MKFFQKGKIAYIQFMPLDSNGSRLSGLQTGYVVLKIIRNIDNRFYDFSTNTFVETGGVTEGNLIEIGTTGIYQYAFNTETDPMSSDFYTILMAIKYPFDGSVLEELSAFEVNLDDIKGLGWDSANPKPTLMNLANKDYLEPGFNPVIHSLQAISQISTTDDDDYDAAPC
jgi:hypothetical protein